MTKDERLAIVDRDFACRVWDEVGGQIEAGIMADAISKLEQWHTPDESPPLEFANDDIARYRFEAYEKVEALIRIPLTKQMRFGKGDKEGRVETDWTWSRNAFFGIGIAHEQVVGWKVLEAKEGPYEEE